MSYLGIDDQNLRKDLEQYIMELKVTLRPGPEMRFSIRRLQLAGQTYGGKAMNELMHLIAHSLVDHPEKVCVSRFNGNRCEVIELRVANEDMGQIIGRKGRTADAIRTILGSISAKEKKRVIFQIIDYHPISRGKSREFKGQQSTRYSTRIK